MTVPIENNKKNFFRLGLLLLFLLSTAILVRYTALGTWFSLEKLQYMVAQTGFWGVLIFIGLYVASAVLNIPGTAFLLLAILLFDYWQGALFTYIGACLGAWATFNIGRKVGGNALANMNNSFIRNVLAKVENRPIQTLIVLRILVQLSPIVGYTLALTNIKEHQYMVGNLIGLFVPIVGLSIAMYFFEDSIQYFMG